MNLKAIFTKKLITPVGTGPLRGKNMNDVKVMENVYIVFDEKIRDITKDAPGVNVLAQASLVTPGFVDCHTHIPFHGFRDGEFVMRSQGKSYVEILKAGGGIHSTVSKVRGASLEDLISFNEPFLLEMLKKGVTTVEGKSGYGLQIEAELKQLKALKKLSESLPISIAITFLGAHAIPKGITPQGYLKSLVENFDKVREFTDTIDIFVDEGAFSIEDARGYLEKARQDGFRLRLHADEIKRTGAALLGVELGAISVDHLLKITEDDIEILARSDTAAVMMPATSFYLGEDYGPARELIDNGAIVALGSDFNPGSNTISDPTLIMHLAVSKLRLTPQEALTAFTLNSAHVLGASHTVGSIQPGKSADMVAWKVPTLEAIPYLPSHSIVDFVVKGGQIVS